MFGGEYGYAQTRVPAVEAALAHAGLASSTARLIGQVGIYQRYMVHSKKSLSTSSLISFPVTLVILLVAFLSLIAALLPLGLAAVCVGVTFGFLYLLTYVVQLSVFVEDTVLILGLGLSIDFSLFMVTRVRESLAREGTTMEQAITEALQTTGRAITVSGPDGRHGARRPVRHGAGRVLIAGHGRDRRRADRGLRRADADPRRDRAARRAARSPLDPAGRHGRTNGSFWRRLADFVVRRRVAVIAVIVPVMLVLSIPIAGMHITLKSISVLPSSDPVRVATADVAEHFGPGAGTPAVVVAQAPRAAQTPDRRSPGVVQVGPAERGAQGWVRVSATLDSYSDSSRADQIVAICAPRCTGIWLPGHGGRRDGGGARPDPADQ